MKKNKKDLELEENYAEDEFSEIENELSDNYEDEYQYKNKNQKAKKIINIIFIILILIMLMIATDVVCVARYNKGPFFAIKTSTYKDGGTKVYYGFGYKVIKYNQLQGRRDTQIGFWTMPYNVEPLNTSSLDLAIEFTDDANSSYKKYYKKFVRISSTLTEINAKNKTISLGYKDEDGKYDLDIICNMADKKIPESLEKDKDITIIGTINDFTLKTKNTPNKLYIANCFAEQ